jgi:spore maturation protein CgeB
MRTQRIVFFVHRLVSDWNNGNAIHEFLFEPIRKSGLRAAVYGVRYPDEALAAMIQAGIEYCGWVPNYRVPEVLASAALAVHIPGQAYRSELVSIPTIRPFEALACGIPLISAPWHDVEKLFRAGQDLLIASDPANMLSCMEAVLGNPIRAHQLSRSGLETIRTRHTCAHRVDELFRLTKRITDCRPVVA